MKSHYGNSKPSRRSSCAKVVEGKSTGKLIKTIQCKGHGVRGKQQIKKK